MGQSMTATERANDATEPQSTLSLLWIMYGQVAAMLGAFSLLALLSNFGDLGLRGVIREAFEMWAEYVRPLVGQPLQWLADAFGWQIALPTVAKDYVAVGFVLGLSLLRTVSILRRATFSTFGLILAFGVLPIGWPLFIAAMLLAIFFEGDRSPRALRRGTTFISVFLAPLVYLALLFAANTWLA